jgi:hypothetical protein
MDDAQLLEGLVTATKPRFEKLERNIQALMQRTSRMPGTGLSAPGAEGRTSALAIAPADGLAANAKFAEFLREPKSQQSALALSLTLEQKATLPITGGPGVIAPSPVTLPRLGPPLPSLRVGDLLPRAFVDAGPAVSYTKETSFTPAADIVPEATLKPTSALTFTNVTQNFQTIASVTKSSLQAVADLYPLTGWIEQRLQYSVLLRGEKYLLSDPTAGMLPQASTLDPAYAPGAGATGLDTIAAAISQLESLGYEPDGIVLNGINIAKMRLLKTTFGSYLWASPDSEVGTSSMWSIPVVRSANMPVGSYLVGSFQLSTILFTRAALILQIAFQNEDDFIKNLMAFRAEERIALAVLLPQGLVTGTLPSGSLAEAEHAPAPAASKHSK